MSTPEQIVRALAEGEPFAFEREGLRCVLCEREDATHEPRCPWRLAVEWVAHAERRSLNE